MIAVIRDVIYEKIGLWKVGRNRFTTYLFLSLLFFLYFYIILLF